MIVEDLALDDIIQKVNWGIPRIVGTSRTQSENHTTGPNALLLMQLPILGETCSISVVVVKGHLMCILFEWFKKSLLLSKSNSPDLNVKLVLGESGSLLLSGV